MIAAAGKTEFQDYSAERRQADQEAFRAGGYPAADANLLATKQLTSPHLIEMKDLSASMLVLAKSYQQAGDVKSSQATLDMAADVGRS